MPNIILHHYPDSPFSEKIRLILAYKELSYQSVIIPVIMPKPLLMPLTGGYRKTPVMQIGADVYCDTEIIARVIDHLHPGRNLYPAGQEATISAFAQWTDTALFRLAVAMAFQPRALASNPLFQDRERAAAFAADRAQLVKGGQSLSIPFEVANGQFLAHLKQLDRQLADGRAFLLGETPCLADFSTYHCVWFVYKNAALRDLFNPFKHLMDWRARMEAFGPAVASDLGGEEAIEIACRSEPMPIEKAGGLRPDDIKLGERVSVMPTDYGLDPVEGNLVVSSLEEIAVARSHESTGSLVVHFPRSGFQVKRLA